MAGGSLIFESDQPLVLRELPGEGHGLKKVFMTGEWDHLTAGGCSNFGLYDKNPVVVFNVLEDSEL